jgi:prepilin-type N-terminal cleavage/methylation domain-containing protein
MNRQISQPDSSRRGFTLIEIVIVLAIAAIIIVVVFLAVTGAQKSSRDNERKAYARLLYTAVYTFMGNNGGSTAALDTATLLDYVGRNKKVLGQSVVAVDLDAPDGGGLPDGVSVTFRNGALDTDPVTENGDACTVLGANYAWFNVAIPQNSSAPSVGVCLETSQTYFVTK